MATVDVDLTKLKNEDAEPVIITLSIEEARNVMHTGEITYGVLEDIIAFIEEYDAHGH